MMNKDNAVVPLNDISEMIYLVRGEKVIFDSDLARIYGVTTKVFNQAVKRNKERFPDDFMFQLSWEETRELRSQFVTLQKTRATYRPYVFTEHGAIMAATILKSAQAREMSVFVARAFVKLREILSAHKELSGKLDELEQRVTGHDQILTNLISAIKQLMSPPDKPKRQIGFKAKM